MPNGKIKIEHRLTTLESRVETILCNHLPHLKEDIGEIKAMLIKHIDDEGKQFNIINDKITNMKLGIPGWMAIIISIFTGLVVFFLTH